MPGGQEQGNTFAMQLLEFCGMSSLWLHSLSSTANSRYIVLCTRLAMAKPRQTKMTRRIPVCNAGSHAVCVVITIKINYHLGLVTHIDTVQFGKRLT